jgi:hypothetical protein
MFAAFENLEKLLGDIMEFWKLLEYCAMVRLRTEITEFVLFVLLEYCDL